MRRAEMTRDEPLRLLFVARAYPPTLGGMENFAHQLATNLSQQADVTLIINRHGKKALPAFLPYAFARATYIVRTKDVQAIHLADALLAPLGVALKRSTGLPVTASVCGLDVTYRNRLYQSVVPRALSRLDVTMPISPATKAALQARAGSSTPSKVIPLGVNPLDEPPAEQIERVRSLVGLLPE
ncbi:MAG: glycosyltransferase, partial [Dehalococcoidia bacterium]